MGLTPMSGPSGTVGWVPSNLGGWVRPDPRGGGGGLERSPSQFSRFNPGTLSTPSTSWFHTCLSRCPQSMSFVEADPPLLPPDFGRESILITWTEERTAGEYRNSEPKVFTPQVWFLFPDRGFFLLSSRCHPRALRLPPPPPPPLRRPRSPHTTHRPLRFGGQGRPVSVLIGTQTGHCVYGPSPTRGVSTRDQRFCV